MNWAPGERAARRDVNDSTRDDVGKIHFMHRFSDASEINGDFINDVDPESAFVEQTGQNC